MASRVIDDIRARAFGTGECSDCSTTFAITLYEGDTESAAFLRDHPANGCPVLQQRTVSTVYTPGTRNGRALGTTS